MQKFIMERKIDDYGKYIIELASEYIDQEYFDMKYRNDLNMIPFLVRAKRLGKMADITKKSQSPH